MNGKKPQTNGRFSLVGWCAHILNENKTQDHSSIII